MEWLADPTAWLGLLTLIVLELVLGIDNLVFIAILADNCRRNSYSNRSNHSNRVCRFFHRLALRV